jgi:hypothetical protein
MLFSVLLQFLFMNICLLLTACGLLATGGHIPRKEGVRWLDQVRKKYTERHRSKTLNQAVRKKSAGFGAETATLAEGRVLKAFAMTAIATRPLSTITSEVSH